MSKRNEHIRGRLVAHKSERTEKVTDPVVIQNKQGNTTYIIQNLNIYITADVVNQLNLNPKEIINIIQDQLKEQIESRK